jgi:hypothetical protein
MVRLAKCNLRRADALPMAMIMPSEPAIAALWVSSDIWTSLSIAQPQKGELLREHWRRIQSECIAP